MQDKVSIKELSQTEYQVSINIPAEEVDKQFDNFLESVRHQAQIPGFRKGKAPINRLKSVLGDKIKAPVSQMLINEHLTKIIKDNDIVPVSAPTVKDMDSNAEYPGIFGFDNSFKVDIIVEVLPKIDPVGYKNMNLNFPEIDKSQLFNKKIDAYREQFAERNQISDRGAKLGDAVVIDFKGYLGDVEFEGGSAEGYTLNKLGTSNFVPGFEEQLVGVKINEPKDLIIKFPQEYRAKHLAGQEATFKVVIHSIIESKLAEVNDDLVLMCGFDSMEELFAQIHAEVDKDTQAQIRQIVDQQVVQKLLENNSFEVPKSMVKAEFDRLRSRIQMETLPEVATKQLEQQAEMGVKRASIIDAIYEKEDSIEITPEELNELLEQHAQVNNKTKDEVVSALYNSGQMDNFMGVLRVSKVMDFIINNFKKEEIKETE